MYPNNPYILPLFPVKHLILDPGHDAISRPVLSNMWTQLIQKLKCVVSVKYPLGFKDLVWKQNIKYLINNFYIDYLLNWYFEDIRLQILNSPVSSHLDLFNVASKNSIYVAHFCGLHYISTGQQWSKHWEWELDYEVNISCCVLRILQRGEKKWEGKERGKYCELGLSWTLRSWWRRTQETM